ncbi:MAG: ABC transporter permease [Actinobacteria bacterium]|nr:ABC transporter permease [Actinomycetota bacterium]
MSDTRPLLARRAGFLRDLGSVALRAVRLTRRDAEAVVPGLVVPLFFLMINIGSLQSFVEGNLPPGFDFKAFQLPVSIIFAVTGISRAGSLVIDVQDGYLDRLLLTPVARPTLLLGLMVADLAVITLMCVPVVILGAVLGVWFETGVLGMLVFLAIGISWGIAFTGFPYAIALKTGNPMYVPQEQMTGWLATVADWNPVTYLLAGMRALLMTGWDGDAILKAFLASGMVAAISFTLAFTALRGRVRHK